MKDLLAAKETALSWLKPVSREILNWFQKKLTVQQKADQSPVTIADQRAEEMLRQKIHRYFPDHGIIGEEFGEEEAAKEWVWTVDPIDGTRSFIQGLPLFATLLSLLHKREPVMGIICLPAMGETVWAVKGKGAYSGNRRLRVSSHLKMKDSVLRLRLLRFPRWSFAAQRRIPRGRDHRSVRGAGLTFHLSRWSLHPAPTEIQSAAC